jgi:hypothetical protein
LVTPTGIIHIQAFTDITDIAQVLFSGVLLLDIRVQTTVTLDTIVLTEGMGLVVIVLMVQYIVLLAIMAVILITPDTITIMQITKVEYIAQEDIKRIQLLLPAGPIPE